jgi:hypothetical protein
MSEAQRLSDLLDEAMRFGAPLKNNAAYQELKRYLAQQADGGTAGALRKAVADHIADLRRCVVTLTDYPQFAATSAEVSKAADELAAALATPPTAPQAGAPAAINQCDGCLQNAPLRNGLHFDQAGRAFMSCQRYRYSQGAEGRQPLSMQQALDLLYKEAEFHKDARMMDGYTLLKIIRAVEAAHGITPKEGT